MTRRHLPAVVAAVLLTASVARALFGFDAGGAGRIMATTLQQSRSGPAPAAVPVRLELRGFDPCPADEDPATLAQARARDCRFEGQLADLIAGSGRFAQVARTPQAAGAVDLVVTPLRSRVAVQRSYIPGLKAVLWVTLGFYALTPLPVQEDAESYDLALTLLAPDGTALGTVEQRLDAAQLGDIRPHLAPGQRVIALVRDGAAARDLATLVFAHGFGASHLTACEAIGGPQERIRQVNAHSWDLDDVTHPVALAIDVAGDGPALPRASGLPDGLFGHDGQITKRPVRALALSALAPRPGELLWDIGAGSGSIGIEWLLSHPACQAIGIEADPARAERAEINASLLGASRLRVVRGTAPEVLDSLPLPQAVFIGGGVTEAMLTRLWDMLPEGTRLVAHAVTIESEALFALWQARVGGTLLRIELAEAAALGRKRGWKASYPVVQWSVTR